MRNTEQERTKRPFVAPRQDRAGVVVYANCQLDRVQNDLGDGPLGMPVGLS